MNNKNLLKFFVDKVDADLLERVKLENLKPGDVEDTNKGDLLHRRVLNKGELMRTKNFLSLKIKQNTCDNSTYNQSVVAHVNDVSEETAIDVFDDGTHADLTRVGVLGLAHPFRSDLRKRYIICNM